MLRVLITGCSSGIGRALADAFKAAGHEVWASARKPEDVARLAAAGFTAVQLDVNDPHALAQLAERLAHEGSGLDVLINNAGYGAMGPLLDGGVEGLQQQVETNVCSVVGVTRALFAALRRTKGLVVNTKGERFCNEQVYGAKLGYELMEKQGGKGWLIIDSKLRRQAAWQCLFGGLWAFQSMPALALMYKVAV